MVKTFLYRECSQHTDELDAAAAKAQGEFSKVIRNRKGPYGMFADLAAMHTATADALSRNGLTVRQYFTSGGEDKSMILVTELAHKGQWVVSGIPIPFFTNPQHTHSYCTYMARLGYSRILCLAVDDGDDGESLGGDEGEASTDLTAITTAVEQATTRERLDALWARVLELHLPDQEMKHLEGVFAARAKSIASLAAPKKEKAKPNADSK